MSRRVMIGTQAVTTANATLGAAIGTGIVGKVNSVLIQQPAAGDAKVIQLAVGTTATALNIKATWPLAAGVANVRDVLGIVLNAGEQLNIIQIGGTTAQAIITVSGELDAT